jgi:hypothetical protein
MQPRLYRALRFDDRPRVPVHMNVDSDMAASGSINVTASRAAHRLVQWPCGRH